MEKSASRAAVAKAVLALMDAHKLIGYEDMCDSDSHCIFYFDDVVMSPEKLHREPASNALMERHIHRLRDHVQAYYLKSCEKEIHDEADRFMVAYRGAPDAAKEIFHLRMIQSFRARCGFTGQKYFHVGSMPKEVMTEDPDRWRSPTPEEIKKVVGTDSVTRISTAAAARMVGVDPSNFRKYTAPSTAKHSYQISFSMWHFLMHKLGVKPIARA